MVNILSVKICVICGESLKHNPHHLSPLTFHPSPFTLNLSPFTYNLSRNGKQEHLEQDSPHCNHYSYCHRHHFRGIILHESDAVKRKQGFLL